jgi:hypothetical protein
MEGRVCQEVIAASTAGLLFWQYERLFTHIGDLIAEAIAFVQFRLFSSSPDWGLQASL